MDTKELEYVLRQEGYRDEEFINFVIFICKEYNLMLSDVYTDHLVLKAKAEFFLAIGQTQIKEAAAKKVEAHSLITSAMLPFV